MPAVLSEECTNVVKYADDAYEDVLHKYFDNRAVLIARRRRGTFAIAPGIFIDFHLILTSYNPFRRDREVWYDFMDYKVCVLKGRTRDKSGAYVFEASRHIPVCARQIIPVPEMDLPASVLHGYSRRVHSPLHDLMVIRINPREYAVRSSRGEAAIGFSFPKPVHIAKPFYELRNRYLMIASTGFRDYDHIRSGDTLLSRRFFTEYVLTDCDEWMPRWWGYFICIKNVDDFKGVGSGALLIHENALFGIGSFMLSKRNQSILVFTDVRKYYRMFGTACHEFEATDLKYLEGYDRDTFWYYAHHKRTLDFYEMVMPIVEEKGWWIMDYY